jgi:hypothetical protein
LNQPSTLLLQLAVDRRDGAVDPRRDPRRRRDELALRVEDALRSARGERALGAADLAAVVGDLGDEPRCSGCTSAGALMWRRSVTTWSTASSKPCSVRRPWPGVVVEVIRRDRLLKLCAKSLCARLTASA